MTESPMKSPVKSLRKIPKKSPIKQTSILRFMSPQKSTSSSPSKRKHGDDESDSDSHRHSTRGIDDVKSGKYDVMDDVNKTESAADEDMEEDIDNSGSTTMDCSGSTVVDWDDCDDDDDDLLNHSDFWNKIQAIMMNPLPRNVNCDVTET